jgi:hypothetical protein
LGLKGQTVASLQAFKKRNEEARRKVSLLNEQPKEVNFAYYRSVLKNQSVIDEIERAFKSVTYDVSKQLKTIEAFEAKAIENAESTKKAVDAELSDLAATLKNIEEARPFEDLTVVCLCILSFTGSTLICYRMMLSKHAPTLMREPLKWWLVADGMFQATR